MIGAAAAASDSICSCLLAAEFKDGRNLIDISPQAEMEYLTESVPFVCHGSGKNNADPFLRFLWNTYWSKDQPPLREGVLAAYWTVKTAIDLRSSGVGFEPDVFVLEKVEGDWAARQIEKAELSEHDEFIEAVTSAMRSVRDDLADGSSGNDVPSPPTMEPPVT